MFAKIRLSVRKCVGVVVLATCAVAILACLSQPFSGATIARQGDRHGSVAEPARMAVPGFDLYGLDNHERNCQCSGMSPMESLAISDATYRLGRHETVESILNQALAVQRQQLLAKKAALSRWNSADRQLFALWFGSASPANRDRITQRVDQVLLLNKQYSLANFRAASPSNPRRFAYVKPADKSRIYLDTLFFTSPPSKRAATLSHEMTHFLGTDDIAYGADQCRRLARISPASAVQNADNFGFYLEGKR